MRQNIATIIFIIWLFAILAIFYVVQKPFQPTTALALSQMGLDLLTAFWLMSLSTALGQRLLSRFALTTGETFILGGGLGLGLLGLLTFALGLLGLFYGWLFIGLTLFLTLLLYRDLRTLTKNLYLWRPAPPPRLAAAYLVALAGLTLMTALLPPTDWDGLFYHLTAPEIFIRQHRFVGGLDVPQFNFPFLMEMLFTYAMLLRGDIAAKLLHGLYGLWLTGLIYLITTRHISRNAGWSAVLIFLSMPMIPTLSTWAYNDLTLAFYQLAALYVFLHYQTTAHRHWLILSGLFAGMAMGLKYTSFVTPLAIGIWLLQSSLRREGIKKTILNLLSFSLPALLIAAPWYLKNYYFMGNPVYPFIFHGLFWDDFRAAWYARSETGIGWDGLKLLQLPLLVTLGIEDANPGDGYMGPLFLIFLPFIFIYGQRKYRPTSSSLAAILFFILLQFSFWTLGIIGSHSLWQSRLLLPAFAALSPIIGGIWHDLARFNQPRFSLQRFLNLLITLVLLFNLIQISLKTVALHPLTYLTGLESRDEYLTRRLGARYLAMKKLNEILPAEAVVLFLWEPRSYHCQVTCRPDSILDRMAHDYYKHPNAAAIAQAWRDEGITHVLLARGNLNFVQQNRSEPYSAESVQEWNLIEKNNLTQLADINGLYQLYQLK